MQYEGYITSGSVLAAAGWISRLAWKLVTNHVEHMKLDIVQRMDSNTKDITQAVENSGKEVVIAIQTAMLHKD